MLKHILLLIALSVWGQLVWAQQKPLQVVTLNTALSRSAGFNFVRYGNERLALQPAEIEKILRPPFVLNLQELLGNKKAERTFRRWAEQKGYYATNPGTSKTQSGGLLMISSEPFNGREEFIPFSKSEIGRRFGVLIGVIEYGGQQVVVMNTHTLFSDIDKPNPNHIKQLSELAVLTWYLNDFPTIMSGDFNSGDNMNHEESKVDLVNEVWAPFRNAMPPGWVGSYEKINSGKFSWEKLNPLVVNPAGILKVLGQTSKDGGWGYPDSTIDHIFANNFFEIQKADVVLNHDIVLIPMKSKSKGNPPRMIRLSDHSACEAFFMLKEPVIALGI